MQKTWSWKVFVCQVIPCTEKMRLQLVVKKIKANPLLLWELFKNVLLVFFFNRKIT